jgi:hypothetical protein
VFAAFLDDQLSSRFDNLLFPNRGAFALLYHSKYPPAAAPRAFLRVI